MINVLGIEFLEWRIEVVNVTSCIGRFQVKISTRDQHVPHRHEKGRNIKHVFQHVTQHYAVEWWHSGGRSCNCSGISFKALRPADLAAPWRRIQSASRSEPDIPQSDQKSAGCASHIENTQIQGWQCLGEVRRNEL